MAGVVLSWAAVGKDFPLPGLWRGRRRALEGVDLEIRAGERVVLLGPNGSGKSTLLRLAIGLVHPDRGTVRLHGLDPRRARARRGLGYLPEMPPGDPQAPVRELVRLGERGAGVRAGRAQGRADELLGRVGLAGKGRGALRALSRGQRQRAALAAVLTGDPGLLVLDEPFSGLDPESREQIGELLASWQEDGRTLVVASHRWGPLEQAADRVVLLQEGSVRWEGSPAELAAAEPGGRPALAFRSRAERDRAQTLVAAAGLGAEPVEHGEDSREDLWRRFPRESGAEGEAGE